MSMMKVMIHSLLGMRPSLRDDPPDLVAFEAAKKRRRAAEKRLLNSSASAFERMFKDMQTAHAQVKKRRG